MLKPPLVEAGVSIHKKERVGVIKKGFCVPLVVRHTRMNLAVYGLRVGLLLDHKQLVGDYPSSGICLGLDLVFQGPVQDIFLFL